MQHIGTIPEWLFPRRIPAGHRQTLSPGALLVVPARYQASQVQAIHPRHELRIGAGRDGAALGISTSQHSQA